MKNKLLIGAALIALSACQAAPQNPNDPVRVSDRMASGKPSQSYQPPRTDENKTQSQKIDAALEDATMTAAIEKSGTKSLAYLEKMYSRQSTDPVIGVQYGTALREAGEPERAAIVLEPFANSMNTPSIAKTEYAAAQLALGNHKTAETYARKAVNQNDRDARAYHYLGITLDAKEEYEAAEKAYRRGLDMWEGDPIPIMNNLALNLASQNNLPEAYEILMRAKKIAPDRIEVERNLRIIKALQETHNYDPKDYL